VLTPARKPHVQSKRVCLYHEAGQAPGPRTVFIGSVFRTTRYLTCYRARDPIMHILFKDILSIEREGNIGVKMEVTG
jgi:hypothetical protein